MSATPGRPPGPGPVFEFEWVVATRRWQGYALRSLFVGLLLAAFIVTLSSRGGGFAPSSIRAVADVAGRFYIAVTGTMLTLVLLAAPAATAGAICLDRARGSLTHLLVTDLSDAEIVLGKLAARLVPVLGLIVCGLPIMALLTLLGGVDPDALIGAFAVNLGVAVLGSALALTFSLWAGKTHEALLGTYAVWGLWLLGWLMVPKLNAMTGLSIPSPPRSADPFYLLFAPYWWPGQVSWGSYLTFLGGTVSVAAALTTLAVLRLRPVCTRVDVKRPGRELSRALPTLSAFRARLAVLAGRLGPSLDLNPVLWREWHRNRPSRWARVVGGLYAALAAAFTIVAISTRSGSFAAWTNGLQVSVGLLLLSVSAATALAEERVRGSLDVLLTTPMSTPEIVLGKWLGAYRQVPLLAVLPGLVVFGSGPLEPEKWFGAAVIVTFVLASGAAVTSLGLAMATWCPRLGRAVGWTVALYVMGAVGWMFAVMVVAGHGFASEGLMMGSPFFFAGELSFEICDGRFNMARHLVWAAFWTTAHGFAALGLLGATLWSFDRCLGRMEAAPAGFHPRRYGPRKLVTFEDPMGPEFAELWFDPGAPR